MGYINEAILENKNYLKLNLISSLKMGFKKI